MPAGLYRFTATSDDGIRVYVDNDLIINQWYEHLLVALPCYNMKVGTGPMCPERHARTVSLLNLTTVTPMCQNQSRKTGTNGGIKREI